MILKNYLSSVTYIVCSGSVPAPSPLINSFPNIIYPENPDDVLVAVVITLKLLLDAGSEVSVQNIRYIAPIWMMCYGRGVYAAGLFSVRAPRILGIAFVVTGAVGLLFFEHYGIVLVALSFEMLHLIFGFIVIA